MLKYEAKPVIWIGDLEKALKEHYGENFITRDDCLRQCLFFNDYCNDTAQKFYICDGIEDWDDALEEVWYNRRKFEIRNQTILFLQHTFPDQDYVWIDVTW